MVDNAPSNIPLAKPAAPVVALSYATPRCFIEREYRHRSANGVLTVVACVVAAVFLLFMVSKLRGAGAGIASDVSRLVIWAIIAACGWGLLWKLMHMGRNTIETIRITEDGIEKNRKLHPWARIASLGGGKVVGGVLLEYTHRDIGAVPSLGLIHTLITTPPLKPAEFDVLVAEVADYLQRAHPHVEVNPVPRRPD